MTDGTVVANFADDTAILGTDQVYDTAVERVQIAVNKVIDWTMQWKIKVNLTKSVRVDFALRPHHHRHIRVKDM